MAGRCVIGRLIRQDVAAAQADNPVGPRRQLKVVRDHNQRSTGITVEFEEQVYNAFRGIGIQVAGGFIGKT